MDGTNLTRNVVTKRIKPDGSGFTVAGGTSNVNSDPVDTAGFDGVRFITGFGAITAGAATSQKAQQGQASNLSDAADLASSSVTVADTDDNNISIVDIYRPAERYVRLATLRATQNAAIDFMIVELYRQRKQPVTQDATVVAAGAKVLASPAEGTA